MSPFTKRTRWFRWFSFWFCASCSGCFNHYLLTDYSTIPMPITRMICKFFFGIISLWNGSLVNVQSDARNWTLFFWHIPFPKKSLLSRWFSELPPFFWGGYASVSSLLRVFFRSLSSFLKSSGFSTLFVVNWYWNLPTGWCWNAN